MTSPATRVERDTFGPIEVPADRLWGAQTQRSLLYFRISGEKVPTEMIRALLLVKRAAAKVNAALGVLAREDSGRHHRGRQRSSRGPPRDGVSACRLADRFGHADQHERQRGACQPGIGDPGRSPGRRTARASERRRQPEPIVERRISDGDERGGRRVDGHGAHPCARCVAHDAREEVRGLCRRSSRSGARTCRTRHR